MKKILSLCIALAILMTVLAVPAMAESKKTISVWHRWSGGTEAALLEVIDMYRAAHPDVDVQVTATEGTDAAVRSNRLVEELYGNLRSLKHGEGFHDGHIHQSVAHAGLRCDVGIVAILAGIGTGNEESLVDLSLPVHGNLVGVGLVFQSFLQRVLDIGEQSAAASLGKAVADERVEAHTASAEEGLLVNHPVVEALYLAFSEHA